LPRPTGKTRFKAYRRIKDSKGNNVIELWGRKNAYNVQKVLWTLDELKLEYTHYDVGSAYHDLETPEFVKMNPHSRIPVLVHNDSVLWESNTIIRYLSATFGENTLWPAKAIQRSYADRWMDWELATLQPDFLQLFWAYYRTPQKDRGAQQIEKSLGRCFRALFATFKET
jgi:glutathione S-transferase